MSNRDAIEGTASTGLNGHPHWFTHPAPATPHDALHLDTTGLLHLLGDVDALSDDDTERFAVQRVARGATLVHEGARTEAIFIVQAGSFKTVRTAEDGYEHVLGFSWRREVLGFDGLASGRYAFAAIALEDSSVVVLPLGGFDALRRRLDVLDHALQTRISRQLRHAGEIAEVMAAVAADVRLARFLVQLSARMAEYGQSPRRLLLRMNRRDIANHLGLAHETISRSFRVLSAANLLRVDNREIEIVDLEGLKACARSTRGIADSTGHRADA
jgi:CRP/FNR family transcriptional regulator